LGLDALIVTKLDGDARGGAALSITEVVGRPIAFASTGETVEDFEPFHPDRLAGRILGMGDVETLIEKAEETFAAEQAEAAAARLLEGTFTLDDFLEQLRALRKMGSISSIMGMVPGMASQVRDLDEAVDERRIDRIEGIINSMTPSERLDPDVIDGSRRARIAAGSGTQVGEINQLVKQFREMRKMMKQMGGRGPGRRKAGRARKKKGRGGRVTAAGPAPIDKKKGLSLPGLGDLPGDRGPSSGGLDLTGIWPSD
jgi:signal recognition particle subunit SRP54